MRKTLFSFLLLASLGTVRLFGQAAAPTPILPVPETKQVEWQKMGTYAFVHFGLNTFSDREWGFGDTPASVFNPTDLDCEQWAQTFVNAGMKGVILTAKHHDGFCLWPTKLTEYCIRNSPYKNGKGDVVQELGDACKKYGLKFAVYLSPWDRNAAHYGTPEYVDYFYKQLHELLTRYGKVFEIWFDGANGGDGWYGGANCVRQIDPKTYYQFERAYQMIDSLQPQAIIFSDTGPGCRWVGNEKGFAGETNWSLLEKGKYLEAGPEKRYILNHGVEQGTQWTAAECDVSIRKGWFYHPEEDNTVKTPEQLLDLYYKSVGRNSTLLLNFPVDRRGRIPSKDSLYAVTFKQYVDQDFSKNLLATAKITATNSRHHQYPVSNMTDGKYDTYWATADGTQSSVITVTWPKRISFNRIALQEYIPLGQRVKSFRIEYRQGTKWVSVPISEQTTTIGFKRLLRFPKITTNTLRIRIIDAKGPICLNEIGVYDAVERPFTGSLTKVPTLDYDIVGTKASDRSLLTDYQLNTSVEVPGRNLTLKLKQPSDISSFHYLPNQSTVNGMVYVYEIWVGDRLDRLRKIAEGEFSNIENNPVLQTVKFSKVRAQYIQLRAVRMVSKADAYISASEIYVE